MPKLIKISTTQMAAFRKVALASFEQRLCERVQSHFNERCNELGPNGTQQRVRFGIERATDLGFRHENHIVDFVALIFAFGTNFGTSRGPKWAREILASNKPRDPGDRIRALNDAALQNLK